MSERKPPLAGLTKRTSRHHENDDNDSPWWTDFMQKTKWRTILGLILVYVATLFNLDWVWGILFLIWVVPDLFSGVTFFIEPISKQDNPFLYWIIVLSWLLMSAYMLSTLFIDYSQYPGWT